MIIGGRYNWRNQPERLVYIGKKGSWHQFEKVDQPGVVWCEVLDEDLHMLEETADAGGMKPAPFDNCQFQTCDLPGQCASEGRCHHPETKDQQALIDCLRTQLADATRKLEEARKAVKAMVEDGWLMHGPEGMSEPQQICYDVYQAIEQGKGGDE